MLSRKPKIPEDLQGIDAALRELRPELPEDRVRFIGARARNRARVSAARTHHKEPSLRSRIAILAMLVLGFGFSGVGAGLAVTGIPSDDLGSANQVYGGVEPDIDKDTPPLLPERDVKGDVDEGGDVPVQETRQLAADDGGELPFTGFAAIPVLLLGLALLTAGFVLRRRGTADDV